MQQQVLAELKQGTTCLIYFKRMKGNKNNLKGRSMNIIIMSMKIISPMFAICVNMIALSQTESIL